MSARPRGGSQMSWWGDWQASRARKRRALAYLQVMLGAPDPVDFEWMNGVVNDERVAHRELAFGRRAIAIIVAERDALDDRTASNVAHLLAAVIDKEASDQPDLGRAWVERWRAYSAALAARSGGESISARLAKVLLAGAGVAQPSSQQIARATQFVIGTRSRANEALRAAFGEASMPEDVRPSAMRV